MALSRSNGPGPIRVAQPRPHSRVRSETVEFGGISSFRLLIFLNLTLCKKKIPHHIKLAVHAWSTKCRRNQKLIAQFDCTLRDERFEPN